MKIDLNGAARELPDGSNLLDAVVAAAGDPERSGIAVALDGEVVPRGRWAATVLDEGHRVEVLEARPGG
jgi:sulfur carrier protein